MPRPKEPVALAAACLLLAGCVQSLPQDAYAPPPAPPQPAYSAQPGPAPGPPEAPPAPSPSQAELNTLVAPIALYPDPLIAILLPASTNPSDIAAAANYLVQYGDRTQIDYQPWDPSARALAHYPSVVAWMAQNIDWTSALGAAFASSPSEVMEAVQRMRQRALSAGTLVSTPQQAVYSDDGYIEIYPADPGYLYVPSYDPGVVYADEPYGDAGPFMNFGPPYPEGEWLSFYFDWGSHRVWQGQRPIWAPGKGWRPPPGGRQPGGTQPWRPRPTVEASPTHAGAIPSPKPLRPLAHAQDSRGPSRASPRAAPPEPGARAASAPHPAAAPQAPRAFPSQAPRAYPAPRPSLPHAPRPEPAPRPQPPPSSRRPDNAR